MTIVISRLSVVTAYVAFAFVRAIVLGYSQSSVPTPDFIGARGLDDQPPGVHLDPSRSHEPQPIERQPRQQTASR
jgi:hypothetical protein